MRKSQRNAEHNACAPSAAVEHWGQIDWKRCEWQVARLQARIVKASQMGRWGKVKVLQRLLTCSFSGKALAVKRVTENKGKRNLWCGPCTLVYAAIQTQSDRIATAPGISSAAVTTGVYSEIQRQVEAALDSRDEGQSHAGAISDGSGTYR